MEKSSKKLLGLALASVSTLVATSALAAPTVNVSGFAQMDFASFKGDAEKRVIGGVDSAFQSGGDVRRARVALDGDLDDLWSYKVTWDVAEGRMDDTWLAFSGCDPLRFRLGRMEIPFGMDFLTKETDRTFMEAHETLTVNHNYVNGGADSGNGHGVGLAVDGHTDMVGYHFGAYLPDSDATTGRTGIRSSSDQVTWAGRLTFAPTVTDEMVYHFGVSYYDGRVDSSLESQAALVPAVGPFVHIRSNQSGPGFIMADGGAIRDVERRRAGGLEAAGAWGPLHAQAEFMELRLDGSGTTKDAKYQEWYAQVGYILTGESRPYSVANGTFGRVSPMSNMGAWEVALRYGRTDLNDADTNYTTASSTKGEVRDWTVGLNWYANDNVAVQFNYVDASADYAVAGTKDRDLKVFGLRAQYSF